MVVVEREVRRGFDRFDAVIHQRLDVARLEVVGRHDAHRIAADFLGVGRQILNVRQSQRANVSDDRQFPLGGFDPLVHDGFAFCDGAGNPLAGRSANVNAHDALTLKQLGLRADAAVIDASVGVEGRVRRGNKTR